MLSPHVILVIGSNLSPLLQIAKMTVTHHSRSGTEADSEEVSDSEDEVDDIYEVEILFKTLGQRKRLDVNIRIIQSQEESIERNTLESDGVRTLLLPTIYKYQISLIV